MDTFPKIKNLFRELYDEIYLLKKDLENDLNYSADHAEIITFVEAAEDCLRDVAEQLQTIESDIDNLNDRLELRNNEDIDEDDERGARMYDQDNDDDDF